MPEAAEKQEELEINDPDRYEIEPIQEEGDGEGEEHQVSEVEEQAREDGWVPKDEWQGDPEKWVEAKEFVQRGELFGRIKKLNNFNKSLQQEVEEMKEALRELGNHNKKIAEQERKKALKELKAARREALQEDDFDTVDEIEERMDELKAVEIVEDDEPKQEQQRTHPAVDAWVEENPWYTSDPVLQGATNAIVQSLLSEDPTLENDPEELLTQAAKLVKKEMPHKFQKDTKRTKVSESTTTSKSGKGKSKFSSRDLNEEQRRIGTTFVKSGALKSLDEYAQQLADLGELDSQ